MPVFATIKRCSKRLEAEEYCTGSKALKLLWKLRYFLILQVHEECKGTGTALVPLCKDICRKLTDGMEDPTWVWQMAFLALMDPSGECIFF
jgi:hypothetical protein